MERPFRKIFSVARDHRVAVVLDVLLIDLGARPPLGQKLGDFSVHAFPLDALDGDGQLLQTKLRLVLVAGIEELVVALVEGLLKNRF